MTGTIFDIQPFALHDGPGIRTTVFLKGCPLRCRWCSNPESFDPGPTLSYDISRCKQCHSCAEVCESKALTISEGRLQVKHALCTGCGKCIEVCPTGALSVYGYEIEAGELIRKIQKDKAYFDRSGGGLTLSGGEPLYQHAFVAEILKLAKNSGLHTCIETSGYASEQALEEIQPYVDLYLFDYKATGEASHQDLTARPKTPILKNLAWLNEQKARIILRCPIVPGLNDNPEHFRAIFELSVSHDSIEAVELMPFHTYGLHKYEHCGLPVPDLPPASADEDRIRLWQKELSDLGCKKLRI